MAAEIKDAFQVRAELLADGGGIFDVVVNDELIFSKHAEGSRFPEPGEITGRIKEMD